MTFLSLTAILLTFFIYLNTLTQHPEVLRALPAQKQNEPLLEQTRTVSFDDIFLADLSIRSDALVALSAMATEVQDNANLRIQVALAAKHAVFTPGQSPWEFATLAGQKLVRLFNDLGLSQDKIIFVAGLAAKKSPSTVTLSIESLPS